MKIKNYFKVILSFMAFALFSFIFAISPTMTAYADMQTAKTAYNLAINSVKMPKKTVNVAEGDKLEIPLLKSNWNGENPTNYTIRVIDPAGQKHDFEYSAISTVADEEDAQETTNDYFTLKDDKLVVNSLNNGTYDIVYIVTEGSKTYYSNTYSVVVKNVSYTLDFTVQDGENKGLEVLLPANVKTSTTPIELPVGYVDKLVDDETTSTGETASIVVMKNGTVQEPGATGSAYTVSAGKHYLTPSEEGTYTIEYTYNKGSNPPTKTYTIVVSDDFVAPTAKDLTITTPTMPTVELGDTDVTLPKLTVSDNLNNNVAYNLKSIKITNSNDSNVTKTLTNNDYTFNMTKDFFGVESYKSLLGNYEVEYNIVDAYDNEKTITVVVKNVKDSTKPEVFMAYDYSVKNGVAAAEFNDDDTVKTPVNTNYSVDLKSKYGYGELVLPAIYATDLVSNYDDFTFVRYIQNTNTKTIYYIDNKKMEDGKLADVNSGDEGYNYSADANIGKYNKAVTFKFAADGEDVSKYAGEYTIGYYVVANTTEKQENYVYSTGTTRYSFTVLTTANSTEISTPTIEINNLKNNSSIDSDATVSVNVTSKDEEEKDTRIKNAVFYYYSTTSENSLEADIATALEHVKANTESDYYKHKCNILDDGSFVAEMSNLGYKGFTLVDQDEDNNNQFNVELTNYTDESSVNIVAIAISDSSNIATDSRTLKINNLDESTVPEWEITDYGTDFEDGEDVATDKVFGQGEIVTLPTVQFTDKNDEDEAGDSSLAMSVAYYIDAPDATDTGLSYKSPTGKQLFANKIVGGTIETTKAGTYYVVYTATDDAGNTSVVYFTFKVENTADPILTVGVTGDDVTASGNTFTGNVGSVITFDPALYTTDGDDITNATGAVINYTINDGGKGLDFATTGEDMTYIFNDEGEYTVTFTASYNGREAIEKVINISISMPTLAWDFDVTMPEYAKAGDTVTLPELTGTQGNKKAIVSVKVTDPDGQDVEVNQVYVDESTVWQFTTNSDSKGTYKIVYTAQTETSTITKEYGIKVGDNVAPTFSMKYESELKKDIVYDGENSIEYAVKLNKTNRTLIIVVNGKEYNTNLTITDKDDAGKTHTITSWSKLTVELLKDGTAISDYATDDNNSNYKTYTISSKGEYTLKLTMTDSYDNEAVKEIKFNVVSKTEAKENNDTVIGAVLIVISLVILAGVILFFTFTGKKGSGKKSRKSTKSPKNAKASKAEKEEVVEDTAEETATEDEQIVIEEVAEESKDAKEGDVE